MNSKCGVQSKRRCESRESCVCIVGFPACGFQKKSVVYETECRHAAVQRGKQDQIRLQTEWGGGGGLTGVCVGGGRMRKDMHATNPS